jgi:peptidyl-prolyl cis-trans isomerase B (cyclophilin B)
MKHSLLVAIGLIFLLGSAGAQTPMSGKPQYAIAVTRADTALGTIRIELFPDVAPKHVANFDSLVSIRFFDGIAFHRVIPGFVIQGGDPNSKDQPRDTWGYGDPSQTTVPAEFSRLSHRRGIISAARLANDINSATSQFFICIGNPTQLDGKYSVYGRVIEGMDVADTIVNAPRDANDNPIDKISMAITRIGVDESVPAADTLLSPADGTRLTSSALKWSAVDGAILYQLQVSPASDFASTTTDTLVPTVTFPTASLKKDLPVYYWRVRATNGGNRGGFSPTWSFTTVSPTSVDDQSQSDATGFELSGAGMASDRMQVRFRLKRSEAVTLTLVDLLGEEISTLLSERRNAGEHSLDVDLRSLPSGTYFCMLRVGSESATRKFVVVR